MNRKAAPPKPDLAPIMRQFKAIAAASGDSLLLADGPPHPDFLLLDLCADALHYANAANEAMNSFHRIIETTADWADASRIQVSRADLDAYSDEHDRNRAAATQLLRRAKKMKAVTPAGIYAKALLVRCSRTGATELAMSLATDLLDCAALRDAMFSAEQAVAQR